MAHVSINLNASVEQLFGTPAKAPSRRFATVIDSMTRVQVRWIGLAANLMLWAVIVKVVAHLI